MTERLTKSERTRQRILDAAARVFREQGYANARLADIAELADMQTGSLYYHFDGREDLVAEILRLGVKTAWSHVRAAVDALPADGHAPRPAGRGGAGPHADGAGGGRLRLGPGPHRRAGAARGAEGPRGRPAATTAPTGTT